jgi:selenocysteine lyase/cysteine desulfurase
MRAPCGGNQPGGIIDGLHAHCAVMTGSDFQGQPQSRRRFLHTTAGAAAALAWPARVHALAARLDSARSEQEYWSLVRSAFLIPERRIYLNVGTLGVQPRPVIDAVVEHTRRVAESFPPAIDWDGLKTRLGTIVGADADGFVFPRNTTEAMNFVAQGLDFDADDEILTTNHEHIGGLCPWQVVAARKRLRLRQLAIAPDASDDAIVDTFVNALGPRTRVLSISHLTFTTGRIMPVARLAGIARERGIIIVADGAHPPGLMSVEVTGLGVDFYASSPHKWLLAAQGTGFLWMKPQWRTRLWPTLASGGWDDLTLGAHRFNHLGTLDESRLAALDAALRFHETLEPARVYDRIRTLRRRLFDGLAAVPDLTFITHIDDARSAGMISFAIEGIESLALQTALGRIASPDGEWSVRTRVIGEYDYNWMRLSPHIYNTFDDIDRAVHLVTDAVAALRRTGS